LPEEQICDFVLAAAGDLPRMRELLLLF